MRKIGICTSILCLVLAPSVVLPLFGGAAASPRAQGAEAKPGSEVQVVVTVLSRNQAPAPAIQKADVVVRQDGQVRPVLEWKRASGSDAAMDFEILLDENLDANVGLQFPDLAEFIRALPPLARVAIAYASNGTARFAQPFTTDREQAIKALRLPQGSIDTLSGIYLALEDAMAHWPEGAPRREILLISHGIDLLRGVAESSPSLNPDLQAATDRAQRNGIVVHTLFASSASRLGQNLFLISNGQSCLGRVSAETGGDAYASGFQTPVSFRPLLKNLTKLLSEQYLLTFQAEPLTKAAYARLQIATEQRRIEIMAPDRVWVPAGR